MMNIVSDIDAKIRVINKMAQKVESFSGLTAEQVSEQIDDELLSAYQQAHRPCASVNNNIYGDNLSPGADHARAYYPKALESLEEAKENFRNIAKPYDEQFKERIRVKEEAYRVQQEKAMQERKAKEETLQEMSEVQEGLEGKIKRVAKGSSIYLKSIEKNGVAYINGYGGGNICNMMHDTHKMLKSVPELSAAIVDFNGKELLVTPQMTTEEIDFQLSELSCVSHISGDVTFLFENIDILKEKHPNVMKVAEDPNVAPRLKTLKKLHERAWKASDSRFQSILNKITANSLRMDYKKEETGDLIMNAYMEQYFEESKIKLDEAIEQWKAKQAENEQLEPGQ